MPRRDLNDRMRSRIARVRRIKTLGDISVLFVCLFVGTGVAFAKMAPPTAALASVQHALSHALAAIGNLSALTRAWTHIMKSVRTELRD